jgi:hypothetical protein
LLCDDWGIRRRNAHVNRVSPANSLKKGKRWLSVFWVVTPYSLVEVYQRFRGAYCLHHRPDDRGNKALWNVGKLLPDYMALQPRRQPSSYSPPWEPQILLEKWKVFCLISVGQWYSIHWNTAEPIR